jgi:hypothetical protein
LLLCGVEAVSGKTDNFCPGILVGMHGSTPDLVLLNFRFFWTGVSVGRRQIVMITVSPVLGGIGWTILELGITLGSEIEIATWT